MKLWAVEITKWAVGNLDLGIWKVDSYSWIIRV